MTRDEFNAAKFSRLAHESGCFAVSPQFDAVQLAGLGGGRYEMGKWYFVTDDLETVLGALAPASKKNAELVEGFRAALASTRRGTPNRIELPEGWKREGYLLGQAYRDQSDLA